MKILSDYRKEIVGYLNDNIGEIIDPSMFSKPGRARDFFALLNHRGTLERIGAAKYKVKKEIVANLCLKNIPSDTRDQMRSWFNKNIGVTMTTQDFTKPGLAANYFATLFERGDVERISWGKYKILKKIVKRKTNQKGKTKNKNVKDLSSIPAILNSDKEGLVMHQIQLAYNNLTPIAHQVNANYLYRLFAYGLKNGVLKHNGQNINVRKEIKGPIPKRVILTNPDISLDEWSKVVRAYRTHYQYKQTQTLNKKSTRPKVMNKTHSCRDIIDNFNEDRDNPNKQFIEDYFINVVKKQLKGELINCFIISGPDYYRHTTKLFDTIANHVMICELKPDIFDVIYKKAQICPSYINNKVSLANCNVDDISPTNCQYLDLDLMGTINNISNSISSQVDKQNNTKLKHLTFTSSIRNDGGKIKRVNVLKELLYKNFGLKIKEFQGDSKGLGKGIGLFNKTEKLNYCLKHIPTIKEYGRVKDIHIFSYQDKTPMLSVLVSYV